ncbi:MAG TPA: response regulator transcription factor, partial [Nocardioidaceae bacterium]|nr:response regulator transcription factor [Nocardioidaceae bacterium]
MTQGPTQDPTQEPRRVLLIDDHDLIRQGLRHAFERAEDFTVVGEASSIAEGLAVAGQTAPDVVIMDIRLPDGSGLDAVKKLRAT